MKVKKLNEASYGGAFDISNDQYFTKEEIVDAAEEVVNNINEIFEDVFELNGAWIEDNKFIVNVYNDKIGEFEKSVKIDMKKIKTPLDLKRKYVFPVLVELIKEIKDIYSDLINEDWTIPERQLEPNYKDGYIEESYTTVEPVLINEKIEVDESGNWDWVDQTFEFATENGEDRWRDWYTWKYIDDKISIVEKIEDLIDDKAPTEPGYYTISCSIMLTYKITTYDEDNEDIDYLPSKSRISNFNIKNLNMPIKGSLQEDIEQDGKIWVIENVWDWEDIDGETIQLVSAMDEDSSERKWFVYNEYTEEPIYGPDTHDNTANVFYKMVEDEIDREFYIRDITNEAVEIEAENKGLLEVPKDKSIEDLPVSHFKRLIDKKGRESIIRGLTNLEVWNKNKNKKLSNWAIKMKKSLEGYGE